VFAPPSPFFKNVQCVRETEIPVEQQPPQGVFVCGHAGLVINKFSQEEETAKDKVIADLRLQNEGWEEKLAAKDQALADKDREIARLGRVLKEVRERAREDVAKSCNEKDSEIERRRLVDEEQTWELQVSVLQQRVVRERTSGLFAPTPPQGVLVRGHAGLVINKLSLRSRGRGSLPPTGRTSASARRRAQAWRFTSSSALLLSSLELSDTTIYEP